MKNKIELAKSSQLEADGLGAESRKILELLDKGYWLWRLSSGEARVHDYNGQPTEVVCGAEAFRDLMARGLINKAEERQPAWPHYPQNISADIYRIVKSSRSATEK